MDVDGMLVAAMDAAAKAGRELRAMQGRDGGLLYKGTDYHTKADLASDRSIIRSLGERCPGTDVLSEESGWLKQGGKDAPVWVIDPLDGTWNYHNGGTWWSVSIGLVHEGRPVLGVVHAPAAGTTYHAVSGSGGAFCGSRPLVPRTSPFIGEWLVSFGAPSKRRAEEASVEGLLFRELPTADGQRTVHPYRYKPGRGSTALELCGLAEGAFNGLVRWGQKPWDVAAGLVIASEAGCALETMDGRSWEEEVGRFSTDHISDIVGASDRDGLATLRRLMKGEIDRWPPRRDSI